MKVLKIIDGKHLKWGTFGKHKIWMPDLKLIYAADFKVTQPSKKWPYGYLKHFYTQKYANLLFETDLKLYLEVQDLNPFEYLGKCGVDRHSKIGVEFISTYVSKLIGGP